MIAISYTSQEGAIGLDTNNMETLKPPKQQTMRTKRRFEDTAKRNERGEKKMKGEERDREETDQR